MAETKDRPYDIVVFGATGFTGALTAEYLARHADAGTRWALAGRNRGKLEEVRTRIGAPDLELLDADVTNAESLRRVAEATKVVITTVGPYTRLGEPLVAACATAGTGYVDLTGEPEFVDTMYLRYHTRAVNTGARIVHACGFDSIPHDLGAHFTVQQLPENVPLRVRGYVSAGGTFSGGTFDSALTAFSRLRAMQSTHRLRKAAEGVNRRRAHLAAGRPGYDRAIGAWVVPFPTLDPQIIARSAEALERYGPDFTYTHYMAMGNPLVAAGLIAGAGTLLVAAQLPPARRALVKLRPSGSGPSAEQRAKGWFKVRFVGEGGGTTVRTEVAGGDPGYGETAKMLAHAALCLAHDDLPPVAGQVTTAQAMGDALRARLEGAGITFRVTG